MHVIFEAVDFIAELAALVPKPRVNLTRYHGVFAPNSKHLVWVTPAKRGKGSRNVALAADPEDEKQALKLTSALILRQMDHYYETGCCFFVFLPHLFLPGTCSC